MWRPEVNIRCLPELHLFVGSGAYRVPPADAEVSLCLRPKAWVIGVSPKPFLFCEY